jgi:hypothetical protein
MSLLDSLLLDPQKLDVWIAVRSDGVKGSGTESDPYNGSPRQESALSVTNLTNSGRGATATANNHGYNDGDVVMISGVTGMGSAQFNGRFSIYGKTTNTFQYAMASLPAGGISITDAKCAKVLFQFDELMYPGFAEYTAIHLGPGVIETRGFSQATGGWSPKSGQKIIGSGIDVTTLKIVHGKGAEGGSIAQYYAIGTFIDADIVDFEASDFTVDCNLGGQPVLASASYFAPVLCGAISVVGSRIRIRRVRAINWGNQSTDYENFVLYVGWSSPVIGEMTDCVIEDCVLEQPALNNAQLVSCLGIGGFVDKDGFHGAFHRGCVVRNCVVDCRYQANPVAISSITYSGTTATVTTAVPHGRANNDWVRIAGAFMNGTAVNPFNGSFQITYVNSTTFQYTLPPTPAATAPPTGDLWVDRFPSHIVSIASIVRDMTDPDLYEVTTDTPHYRKPGDPVSPNRIKVPSGDSTVYNGLFQVYAVSSPTKFQYKLLSSPEAYPPDLSMAVIGNEYHGIGTDAGTGAVEEGNQVYGARFGHYNDTGSTKDVTIRNNYYYDVVCGVYYSMGLLGATTQIASGQSITYDPATNIATFTTPVAHGLLPKSAVQITGALIGGNPAPANTYNGFYEVLDAPIPTTFRYQMGVNPGQNADQNSGLYAEYWRVRRLVVENNAVELTPTLPGTSASLGILLADYPQRSSLNLYLQSVIRENVIREVNDATDSSSIGIYLWKCENALTEQNLIDPAVGSAILQYSSGSLEYFGNSAPSGSLLQGYDQQQSRKVDELTTKVQDSLLLSII